MKWTAILEDGSTFHGPRNALPRDLVKEIVIGPHRIQVPKEGRLVLRHRFKENLMTGEQFNVVMVAFEPPNPERRMTDSYGYVLDGHEARPFRGYGGSIETRAPMLAPEDF